MRRSKRRPPCRRDAYAGVKFVGSNFHGRWWLTSPAHQGDHGVTVKPLRRDLWRPRLRALLVIRMRGCGCIEHPTFPASYSLNARTFSYKAPGERAPQDRGDLFSPDVVTPSRLFENHPCNAMIMGAPYPGDLHICANAQGNEFREASQGPYLPLRRVPRSRRSTCPGAKSARTRRLATCTARSLSLSLWISRQRAIQEALRSL
jgi:hypothetical protein